MGRQGFRTVHFTFLSFPVALRIRTSTPESDGTSDSNRGAEVSGEGEDGSQLKISKGLRALPVATSIKQLEAEKWNHFTLASQPGRGFWTKCLYKSSLAIGENSFPAPS